MEVPPAVTVGVVLYSPAPLGARDLERESGHAADLAMKQGVPRKNAFGQAIARRLSDDEWQSVLANQSLPASTDLLASVHFFEARPDPALVAAALAVLSHAWVHRRIHGTEPPGSLPLKDMPPGPLAAARVLRDAAATINAVLLDDGSFGPWMKAHEQAWG